MFLGQNRADIESDMLGMFLTVMAHSISFDALKLKFYINIEPVILQKIIVSFFSNFSILAGK